MSGRGRFSANLNHMKKCFFIAAAAAVFALASCQKETTMRTGSEGLMNEISLRTANGMVKSAINGTTFPAAYDMYVSAYRNLDAAHKGTDSAADFFEGIHFTKGTSDDVWHAVTPKYWPLTGNLDLLAIACAGYNSTANGIVPTCTWGEGSNVAKKVVVTVPDNSAKFDDILFGAANAQAYNASGTAMAFKHSEAAIVFTAKSNIEYNATDNLGITINSIAVDSAMFSGTLTVSNPAAGGSTGDLSAGWSNLGDQKPSIKARVWDTTSVKRGINPSESELTDLHLLYTKSKADSLSTFPFGEAYVILPAQPVTKFTITYTIHNGKDASGNALDNTLQYRYTALTGTWDQGNKYVYDINITLKEITIKPDVVAWSDQTATEIAISQ